MNVLRLSSGSGVIYGHSENAAVVLRTAPPGGHTHTRATVFNLISLLCDLYINLDTGTHAVNYVNT